MDVRTTRLHISYEQSHALTGSAFGLLKSSPHIPIFISYKRSESSLLALYIQARFASVGATAFLDINSIKKGEDWEQVLQKRIAESAFFISVLAPKTLESDAVMDEIQWAYDAHVPMIPVMHNGFAISKSDNPAIQHLFKHDGFTILDMNNAFELHSKTDALLIDLGYVGCSR